MNFSPLPNWKILHTTISYLLKMTESSPLGLKSLRGKWAISPFPTGFSKDLYCRHIKTRACLEKGLIHSTLSGTYVTMIINISPVSALYLPMVISRRSRLSYRTNPGFKFTNHSIKLILDAKSQNILYLTFQNLKVALFETYTTSYLLNHLV